MAVAVVQAGTRGAGTAAVSPRLSEAAHQFEALLMKELLKPMTESSLLGENGEGGDLNSGSGALSEFASESLGMSLSRQGGLGIANRVLSALSPQSNAGGDKAVTTEVHSNTALRSLE